VFDYPVAQGEHRKHSAFSVEPFARPRIRVGKCGGLSH